VLLCGQAPDVDRRASDVRNVPKPGISLRKLKKFHFGKTRLAKLKENSFEETSETKECPHCLESGLAITDVIAPATSR
jgi:hypothetical protein